jgi:phage terminase large subunit
MQVWSRQAEFLRTVAGHDRTAIKAGRKVSKSTSLVVVALWAAMARSAKVLMTSTSFPQVKGILWSELRTVVLRSGLPFTVPLDPATGLTVPGGGSIAGRTADNRENMQGYSGADALFLVDEASGIAREIMEAIDGNTAGGGKIVLAGNPTRLSGPFYDAFHRASTGWRLITVSSEESPNVTGEAAIPGLATPAWINQQRAEHGEESPYYAVHVRGEFPMSGANSVIPLSIVQAAEARWADMPNASFMRHRLHLGVDPARDGTDQAVVYARRGPKAYPPLTAARTDSYQVAALAMRAVELYARSGERPLAKVDVIGVGAGAYDVLRHAHAARLETVAVNVAESPTAVPDERSTTPGYRKLRDQLWFGLRDWLKEGGAYPPDQEATRLELVAATFRFDPAGRYVVSGKDELREQLGRSSDHADALALAVYTPPPELITDEATAGSLYR